jgi:hypothetical protein
MVRLAPEKRGDENEQMATAVGALCRGMFSGIGCGALEGGALAMWLLADRPVDLVVVNELVDWFRGRYEAVDCEAIIADDLMARYIKCPRMLADTFKEALEILDALGFLRS